MISQTISNPPRGQVLSCPPPWSKGHSTERWVPRPRVLMRPCTAQPLTRQGPAKRSRPASWSLRPSGRLRIPRPALHWGNWATTLQAGSGNRRTHFPAPAVISPKGETLSLTSLPVCWAFKQIKASCFILNFHLTCGVLKPSRVFQKKKLNGIFLPVTVNNLRAFKRKRIGLVWL